MSGTPSADRARGGLLAAAALVVASVIGVALWWSARAAEERRITDELSAYGNVALPHPDMPVDSGLAAIGARLFERHCAACHAVTGEQKLGPNLAGVTERREPGWIQAMVLNPDSMTREDPVASALKASYGVPMVVVGEVGESHTRAILEFLRRVDRQNEG